MGNTSAPAGGAYLTHFVSILQDGLVEDVRPPSRSETDDSCEHALISIEVFLQSIRSNGTKGNQVHGCLNGFTSDHAVKIWIILAA